MNATKLLLSILLLAAAGVAAAQSSNRPAVLGGGGRYVFGQINEYNADQYMLDTISGRLWRLVDTADGRGSILEPVPYALPDGRNQLLPPAVSGSEAIPAPPAPAALPHPLTPFGED